MTETRALTNYDKAWADQQEQYAYQPKAANGTFLSTRSGILTYGEETLPGNQACVIILHAQRENTYYPDKFVEGEAVSPTCYAFGQYAADMAPHESMQVDLNYFKPQSDTCQSCKWNEWGSADTGRGKACQNRSRLALIPAGYYATRKGSRDFDLDIFNDPKHFQKVDIAYIKLPVTSVANWDKYVASVAANNHRPPHGVITRMFLEPDPKSQYKVWFELVEEVPDELASLVMERAAQAAAIPVQGYQVPEEPAPVPQGSLRGLRRGR